MITLLRADIQAWNKYRKENPLDTIDLSGANFTEVNFSGLISLELIFML